MTLNTELIKDIVQMYPHGKIGVRISNSLSEAGKCTFTGFREVMHTCNSYSKCAFQPLQPFTQLEPIHELQLLYTDIERPKKFLGLPSVIIW